MYRVIITPLFKPPVHIPRGFQTKEEALAFANTACEKGCERLRNQLTKKEPSANPYFRYRVVAPLDQKHLAICRFHESGGPEVMCLFTVEEHFSYSVRVTGYGVKKRTATVKDGIPFREHAEKTMLDTVKRSYRQLVSRIRSTCPLLSEVDGFPFVNMKVEGKRAVIFVQDKEGRELPIMTFEVIGGQNETY